MRGHEYISYWLSQCKDYLGTILGSFQDTCVLLWNSDFVKQLSEPKTLRLFGISALLGIITPLVMIIIWRQFNRRKIERNPPGGFNSKVLTSIKKREPNQVPDKPTSFKKQSKLEKKSEPKTSKQKSAIDSTRINKSDDFKLDDEDVKEISNMEFYGKLKSATLRARADKIEGAMSAEEREKENKLKMEQLEKIFNLMQKEGGEKFGITSQEELVDQMKFYGS